MTEYVPKARCPNCGRAPSVRFSESEVERAKHERQSALVVKVRCGRDRGAGTRLRCGTLYWIRARDIAQSTPSGRNGVAATNGAFPPGFPDRAKVALSESGISLAELRGIEDWQSIPGIGPTTEREMRAALRES